MSTKELNQLLPAGKWEFYQSQRSGMGNVDPPPGKGWQLFAISTGSSSNVGYATYHWRRLRVQDHSMLPEFQV